MKGSRLSGAVAALGVAAVLPAVTPAVAGTVSFDGTRSNTSLGGLPGGRCGAAITVLFAPDSVSATGTSNLGSFVYTGSHCIVPPLPAPYVDGIFEWDFGDGKLFGTYTGAVLAGGAPGQFGITENIVFDGGTGRFAGATGAATATGTLSFGMLDGRSVSFGEARFEGELSAPAIPEPGTWALMAAGLALLAARGSSLSRGGKSGEVPARA